MPRITKRVVDAFNSDPAKLTAKAKVADQYLWDDELPGFGVKVTPANKKVFLIQYRVGRGASSRTRRVTLGNLGPVTCDEARTRAKELLGMTKQNKDPAAELDAQKAEKTLGQIIEKFEKDHIEPNTKPLTAKEYKRALKLHVPQNLRRRAIGSITLPDMSRLHQDLSVKPGRTQANKVLAILSKLFSWAEKHGYRPAGPNPCRHVERHEETKRERFLSPMELGKLGKSLAAEPRVYVVAAIRLLLFTGARLNEILTAKWEWVDFKQGTIRLPDSKTGAKTLYLNAPALAVLEALPRVRGNPFIVVGEKDGAHLVNMQKPWRAIRKAAGVDDVRLHDLRHTFASVGVTGGGSLPIVGALLGHSQPQTTDRYSHLASDPLRAASDAIARQIEASLDTKVPPENVVPIQKAHGA